MKKTRKTIKILITGALAAITFPLMVAYFAVSVPEKQQSETSYEESGLSYFASERWITEKVDEEFTDIAYFFDDVDWRGYAGQIMNVCLNPAEAARIAEKELHFDLTEFREFGWH